MEDVEKTATDYGHATITEKRDGSVGTTLRRHFKENEHRVDCTWSTRQKHGYIGTFSCSNFGLFSSRSP